MNKSIKSRLNEDLTVFKIFIAFPDRSVRWNKNTPIFLRYVCDRERHKIIATNHLNNISINY